MDYCPFHIWDIWDVILPIDELHDFSEGLVETTNQFVNPMMDLTGFHHPGGKMEVFDNKHIGI